MCTAPVRSTRVNRCDICVDLVFINTQNPDSQIQQTTSGNQGLLHGQQVREGEEEKNLRVSGVCGRGIRCLRRILP